MPSTYTSYYNIWSSQRNSQAASAGTSRRSSSSSNSQNRKFSLKSALDQLKPTTETIKPAGIYTPIIRNGPLFSRKNSSANSSSSPRSESEESLTGPHEPRRGSGKPDTHSVMQAAVQGAILRR